MPKQNIAAFMIMMAIMLGASSCTSSRRATTDSYTTTHQTQDSAIITTTLPHSNSDAINKLLQEAESWLGTKYKYGGNDRNGIDCSGFVLQVFNHSLGIKLPRTSHQQFQHCTPLTRDQLQPGDLVFFTIRGSSKVGHVGIYIGNDKMIHASSSQGVIITPLSQKYYATNYYGAGRINAFFTMVVNEQKKAAINIATAKKSQDTESESILENPSEFFD